MKQKEKSPTHRFICLSRAQIGVRSGVVVQEKDVMICENCALLCYYTACSGHSLLTFRDKTLEDGPDRLFQNFGK